MDNKNMNNLDNYNLPYLPAEYLRAVSKEQQGSMLELSYQSNHYINEMRQLVTNRRISCADAGRETAEGLAITKKCMVYLPAGYEKENKEKKYNVLYLLHGVCGNRYEWLCSNGKTDENFNICNLFDHMIINGEMEPAIVVFPEGRSAWDWTDISFHAEGTNMLGFYYFDYEMRYDLLPFIETEFNTYADSKNQTSEGIAYNRLHRAIAGLSMGGMQSLNLGLGGSRCDNAALAGTTSPWNNGLVATHKAPGMEDLFAYVGAFSNAPTSSEGKMLGTSIVARGYQLRLLYIICGDADEVAYPQGFLKATEGLLEAAGEYIYKYYDSVMKDCIHDFKVWNNGAYQFAQLAFVL